MTVLQGNKRTVIKNPSFPSVFKASWRFSPLSFPTCSKLLLQDRHNFAAATWEYPEIPQNQAENHKKLVKTFRNRYNNQTKW